MKTLVRLLFDDAGQDLAEYGIALAVIGLGAGIVAATFAMDVGSLWEASRDAIQDVIAN
jgi:hypothetical protein